MGSAKMRQERFRGNLDVALIHQDMKLEQKRRFIGNLEATGLQRDLKRGVQKPCC